MKLLRSLRVRLLLMFMFVILVTLTTIALAQQATTASAFRDYQNITKNIERINKGQEASILDLGSTGAAIANMLRAYALGDMKQVHIQAQQIAQKNTARIILIDHAGRVVVDSSGQLLENTLVGTNPTFATNLLS